MKNVLFVLSVLLTLAANGQQVPRGINYQAIALDANGNPIPGVDIAGRPIADSEIGVKFTILEDSPSGLLVYQETHVTNTDLYGLFSLEIGQGSASLGDFDSINWGLSNFLRVEISVDNDNLYALVSEQAFLSVPYSFVAERVLNNDDADSLNEIQSLTLIADTLFISKSNYVIFTPDSDGDPTNEMQSISISNDTIALTNGGNIKLPANLDNDPSNEIQQISIINDTIFLSNGGQILLPVDPDGDPLNEIQNISISADTIFLTNGGFIKLPEQVDNDGNNEIQTLVFSNDTLSLEVNPSLPQKIFFPFNSKAEKLDDLTDVTYRSTGSLGMGTASLQKDSLGENNTAVGHFSSSNIIDGPRNSAFGAFSLFSNESGQENTAVGYGALQGLKMSSSNTAVGAFSMSGDNVEVTGDFNSSLGAFSLSKVSEGSGNTSIGSNSLFNTTTGSNNVSIGLNAGSANTTGIQNTFLGNSSNSSVGNLENSIAIGHNAIVDESNSIQIGNTSSEKLKTSARIYAPSIYLNDSSTSSNSAILSLNSNSKGVLFPRMTLAERNSFIPVKGLVVYCLDCVPGGELQSYNGSIWNSSNFSTTNSQPSLNLNAPEYISSDSVGLSMVVLHSGGLPILSSGMEISTTSDFLNSITAQNTQGSGYQYFEFNNITPNTTYFYRAFSENSLGRTFSVIASFNSSFADSVFLPVLTLKSNISATSVAIVAEAVFIQGGNQAITSKGFLYGLNSIPTFADGVKFEGSGVQDFQSIMSNLQSDTTYFIRAFALSSSDTVYSVISQIQTLPSTQFFNGQLFGGGIIFNVDSTGQHGLIAALNDLGQMSWGCEGVSIDSTSQVKGAGLQNSIRIASYCFSNDTLAAVECLNLVFNGFGDWYLPSLDELEIMKNDLYDKGYSQYFNSTEGSYWSSTETNENEAESFLMFNSSQFNSSLGSFKSEKRSVHPIRSF